ncbi:OmpA family protein [Sphingobacterium hungaricum]|uniref:OmpA-like domain-containing protein n=1 Tax=Sphingobacterium hungaricum TaxID=2082723 RepID=A0A928UWJ9_9SPHI|nr:OmpA family protein [Sphingobacterium hungaricum]MBE8712625.1 hypothetical protein [Sphingobacterium hungaricum]
MRFILILVISLLFSSVFAQAPSTVKKAQEAYEKAGKHLALNEYEQAIRYLEQATALDAKFATAYQQLGDIYRKQEKYQKAATAYQNVISIKPNLTSLTYFGLGESLLFTGKYQDAIVALNTYKSKQNLSEKSLLVLNKYLKDCEFSLANSQATTSYLMHRLPNTINSANDEYFPQLTADHKTIIFTRKLNNQENFYESIFKNDTWSVAQILNGAVNSDEFNEGAHCISPDGKYIFFTGCNRPNGLGSCDLYVAKKENGVWSQPHNLGAPINSKGWEAQPSISADGKTLYFVSNRAGGIGGYDLYKSQLKSDGSWGTPVNLGKEINTPFNESAPYIHANNQTLYFASDGWPGFGRKDIFKSTLDSAGNWSTPENLGAQVNNYAEQMSMHVSMNGETAHLAAQDSTGQFDIYAFELPKRLQPKAVAYILGTILDAKSKAPIQALVSVTNTNTQQIVYTDQSDNDDGKYLATLPIGHNYAVHIQKEGYLFDSKQYAMDDAKFINEEFIHTTLLEPIESGKLVTLNNIYFDVNKFDLLPTSISDLDVLLSFLKLNPKVSIELAGHTDNTGNKTSNQLLSENRAKAVVTYLTNNGISSNRLKAVGYGDSKPIADNISDEGKQLNRRTEFKVL